MRINLPAEREEVPCHMVTRSKTVKRKRNKAIRHGVDSESCKCVDITSDSDDGSNCAYYPVEQTVDLGKLSFPSSEREKVKSPTRSRKDPAQVEVTVGDLPDDDDDVESISAQMPENLGDSVSDEEVNESVNVTREEEHGRVGDRPKRMIKPVQKLSYDELGKSTDRPLTIVYRGMVVILRYSKVKSACKTLWCHPMATCEHCVNEHPKLKSEVMLQL